MSKRIKYLFIAITFAVLAWLAGVKLVHAEDINLSWTNPTDTEACTAGGAYTNPAGTRIWQLVADIPDPNASTFTLSGYEPGDYTFVATSYDTNGVGSRISGQTEKTVTSMTVTNGTAYIMARVKDRIILLVAGTVPVGTECITDQTINGLYAVPSDTFTPTTNAKPVLVLAECS